MKALKYILPSFFALILGLNINAQSSALRTETFYVSGNCGMCKSRIEKAAKVSGVTKVQWNEKSHILTLVYNPQKIKSDDIQKRIAAVGHDTPKFKADAKTYNSLPGCCKYERK